MITIEEYKANMNLYYINIKNLANELKKVYETFFDFNIIFTSDEVGKTQLNLSHLNSSNEIIKNNIQNIKHVLSQIFSENKRILQTYYKPTKDFNNLDLVHFVFDNKKFFDSFIKLNEEQKNLINLMIEQKDLILNLKHYISMFQIDQLINRINRFDDEDLINSKKIFDIVNELGILNNQFESFYEIVSNLPHKVESEINLDGYFLENIILIKGREVQNFESNNRKYQFLLNFQNNSIENSIYKINKYFIENIVSEMINLSCTNQVASYSTKMMAEEVVINLIYENSSNNSFTIKTIDSGIHSENYKALTLINNLVEYLDASFEIKNTKESNIYIFTYNILENDVVDNNDEKNGENVKENKEADNQEINS